MRTALLPFLAAVANAVAIPAPATVQKPQGSTFKQFYLTSVSNIQHQRYLTESPSAIADGKVKLIEKLEPQFWPGSKRFKIRYGPFEIPAWNSSDATLKHTDEGGILTTNVLRPTMPCFDCLVTFSFFDLEYEDGTVATDTSGAWLHHAVMLNIGEDKRDLECHKQGYEIAFGGGNERGNKGLYTDMNGNYPSSGNFTRAGYYIAPKDRFTMAVELMNLNNTPRKVYITTVWEFLKGKPQGFKKSRALWQDLSPCSQDIGAATPPEGETKFTLSSPLWTSQVNGELAFVVGHLHDGGTHLELYHNNQVVCTSKAVYSANKPQSGAFKGSMGMGMEMSQQPIDHISSMTACPNVATITEGDTMYIKAYYDFDLHPGMETVNGKPAPVMGIAAGALLSDL